MRLNRSLVLLAEVKRDLDRIERFERLDEGLIKGNLSDYLIIEADPAPASNSAGGDAKKAQARIGEVIKSATAEIQKLKQTSTGLGNLKSINDFIAALTTELNAVSGAVNDADVDKGGTVAKLFGNSFTKLQSVVAAISTAENTIASGVRSLYNTAQSMDGFDGAVNDKKTFRDMAGGKASTLNTAVTNIKKAIGAGEKGFFSKIGGALKGFFTGKLPKIDADQFAEDLLNSKMDIIQMYINSPAVQDASSTEGDTAQQLSDVAKTPEVAPAAAAAAPGGSPAPAAQAGGGGKRDTNTVQAASASTGAETSDNKTSVSQPLGKAIKAYTASLAKGKSGDAAKAMQDVTDAIDSAYKDSKTMIRDKMITSINSINNQQKVTAFGSEESANASIQALQKILDDNLNERAINRKLSLVRENSAKTYKRENIERWAKLAGITEEE